ncbi:hypothetical protein L4D09_19640 [Photobacterium makurazakiensis]|uniref:hypothetical protein n=1 Tax=Photobacterium makurazakiensis TaxID=2910234 RepID=UPI003D0A0E35
MALMIVRVYQCKRCHHVDDKAVGAFASPPLFAVCENCGGRANLLGDVDDLN